MRGGRKMKSFTVTIRKGRVTHKIKCTEKNIRFKISQAKFYRYEIIEIFEHFLAGHVPAL